MNFKKFLQSEMAITNFKKIGDFGPLAKRNYGFDKKDAALLNSERAIQKIHRSWSNSKNNFSFYFLRTKKAYKHVELGQVSPEWVKENLELEIQPKEDEITVIFTNNTGTEKIIFTAWAIAHRLGHSIRKVKEFEIYFLKELEKDFREILKNVYQRSSSYEYRADEKDLRNLAFALGTMKSARDRKLVNFYEFPYELMAQYIITGKIKFNPLPTSLILQRKMAWGRPNDTTTRSKVSDEELQEWNEMLDGHAQKYEYHLDTIFDGLVGKIFVM